MKSTAPGLGAMLFFALFPQIAAAEPVEAKLPPAVGREVSFETDVRPLLLTRCAGCHTGERARSGLEMDTRESLLEGGYSDAAIAPGQSDQSLLIHLVAELEPERVMPLAGERLSAEEIGILRAWIDQGAKWPEGFNLAEAYQDRIKPRHPAVPAVAGDAAPANPVDRFLTPYYAEHGVAAADPVPDRVFARRVWLDLVGLLPPPDELAAFVADETPDKRARLVRRLLDDRRAYADHWLTFWSDALRNDYRGTGFIDGGRSQITGWLYKALYENKPYDQFVHELVSPVPGSEGFTKGIKWRGVVNASQRPEMQAAQNVAQVFLGTNLKCASCHESFVNEWTLEDSWGLAGVFADGPLEMHRCNKPTGEVAEVGFIFPQLGRVDAAAPKAERMRQLADVITSGENGRLARTIVNRLWARLLGRGLVEPVDDMDQAPLCRDLLDWLGADLTEHGYDLKRTLEVICTSQAYQRPSVGAPGPEVEAFVFRGPLVKRMDAEQFADAVSAVTGVWPDATGGMKKADGRGQGGQLAAIERVADCPQGCPVRASLADADPLTRALGRPNREQVVTRRDSVATTLQALELTNGGTLDRKLAQGAKTWIERTGGDADALVERVYATALGRKPNDEERAAAGALLGSEPTVEGVHDFLWAVAMLPEFQLIH